MICSLKHTSTNIWALRWRLLIFVLVIPSLSEKLLIADNFAAMRLRCAHKAH